MFVIFLMGLFFIILGYLIKKFTLVKLISGYDELKCTDKKGLAKYIGNELIIIGSGLIVIYLVDYAIGLSENMLALAVMALLAAVIIPGFSKTKRFMNGNPGDNDSLY